MPVQNEPLPTSAGMRSDASNRPVPVLEGLGQHLRRAGEELIGVAVGPDVHVGRDARRRLHATHLALHVLGDEALEEVLRDVRIGGGADDGQLTGVEGAVLVDGREREPVEVDPRLLALERRLGGDEARLPVQEAARAGR